MLIKTPEMNGALCMETAGAPTPNGFKKTL
jgi:hypothetical protein